MCIYMYVCKGWAHACHSTHVETRGQLVEICSELPGLVLRLSWSCDFLFLFNFRLILKMLTVHHANVNLSIVGLKALDLLLDSGKR